MKYLYIAIVYIIAFVGYCSGSEIPKKKKYTHQISCFSTIKNWKNDIPFLVNKKIKLIGSFGLSYSIILDKHNTLVISYERYAGTNYYGIINNSKKPGEITDVILDQFCLDYKYVLYSNKNFSASLGGSVTYQSGEIQYLVYSFYGEPVTTPRFLTDVYIGPILNASYMFPKSHLVVGLEAKQLFLIVNKDENAGFATQFVGPPIYSQNAIMAKVGVWF